MCAHQYNRKPARLIRVIVTEDSSTIVRESSMIRVLPGSSLDAAGALAGFIQLLDFQIDARVTFYTPANFAEPSLLRLDCNVVTNDERVIA